MRWEDERYVKLYTRDTVDWHFLSFEAQGLLTLILRKVDRAGILSLGKHGKRGVAAAIGHPNRTDAILSALEELIADGCARVQGDALILPNFIEAQEAKTSDAQRKRDQRERDRDLAMADGTQAGGSVIYFLRSEGTGLIKIGKTDNLEHRISAIQLSEGCAVQLLANIPGDHSKETEIHKTFSHLRQRGEWFTDSEEIRDFIKSPVNGVTSGHAESQGVTPRQDEPSLDKTIKNPLPLLREPAAPAGEPKNLELLPQEPKGPTPVEEVMAHYLEVMVANRKTARSTSKGKRMIAARLAEGFSVAELKQAIDGLSWSDFHRKSEKFFTLKYAVRSSDQVEMMMATVPVDRRSA